MPAPKFTHRDYERAAMLRAGGMKLEEIAAALGCSTSAASYLTGGIEDKTPGCARCGLRGEHVCLPTTAVAYLRRQDEAA